MSSTSPQLDHLLLVKEDVLLPGLQHQLLVILLLQLQLLRLLLNLQLLMFYQHLLLLESLLYHHLLL